MAPQTVRPGTVDAHRVAAVAVTCRDVRVGAGVPDVVLATTEGACALWPFSLARLFNHATAVTVPVVKIPEIIFMFLA